MSAVTDTESSAGADGHDSGADRSEMSPVRRQAKHSPDHWRLAGAAALLSAGLGLVAGVPSLLLVAVVAVGMLAVRSVTTPPEPAVTVDRSLSPEEPAPGETVAVETTITNAGEQTYPDCRFIDRVPDELRVVEGSPRSATALGPGEDVTLSYEIEAHGGVHQFDGVYAIVSDWAAANEHEYEIEAEQVVTCRREPEPLAVPALRALTTPYAGRLATDNSGEGLEFYAIREYRTGDPLRRVDWNQYASSGELATLQFRTERSAAVTIVVDNRPSAYVRTNRSEEHAVMRCLEAAGRVLVTLLEANHRAGLATLSGDFWLPPGSTSEHRTRALDALSEDQAFSARKPTREFPVRLRTVQLLQRLGEPAQVVICTPLVDDAVEVPIQLLEAAGHEVTVLSPDPTEMNSRGGTVAALERSQRLSRVHGYGVPVIDWSRDDRLDVAIARTMSGWSK